MSSKRRRSDGFNEPQRQWILARDSRTCQLCGEDSESATYEVHHIIPWRWASTVLHWTLERVNNPMNGITLCKECHVGNANNSIHPDWARGMQMYHEDKKITNKIFAARDDLCRKEMPYWNTVHDNTMVMIAVQNTMEYIAEGNGIYPISKPQEGGIRKKPIHKAIPKKEVSNEEVRPAIIHKDIQSIAKPVQSLTQFLARNKE